VTSQGGAGRQATPGSADPHPDAAAIDRMDDLACAHALAPLFEGAPRFLRRLCGARPYGTAEILFERARELAQAMPEVEQLELIDAHPRLGAPPGSVSAMSFVEQGYDRERADAAAEAERARVGEALDRRNEAYERRFGFRYCVFVAGRPRAALLPELEAALGADRDAEIRRALDAVVDIAQARYRVTRPGSRS
jgi:2-oxo-4-hydroxy-4-carboxy--5-ureidoimidazoline (OHCU) decarboxylase